MKKSRVSAAAAMLLLIGMCAQSSAAETEKNDMGSFYLDDIVVTATTTPSTVRNTNASIHVVSREEIERNHYTTLKEALENVPGVNSITYGEGIGFEVSAESNVRVRGTNKVVVLMDGIPYMTDIVYRGNLFNMNMDDVERIEVLRGSASTLYGADAVGGVINIITKKHYDKPQGKLKVSAGNYGRQNYHFNHQGEEGKVFWSVSYDKFKRGDYKDGYGMKYPTSLDQDTVDAKLGVHLSKVTDFTVRHHWMHRDGWSTYEYPDSGPYRWGGEYYERLTTVSLDYRKQDGTETNTLAFSRGSFSSDRQRGVEGKSAYAQWEAFKRNTYRITDRYSRQLTDNNRISAGFDWQKNDVSTSTAPNRFIKEQSLYIQDEWDITKKWNLTAGLRYVHSDSYASQYLDSESLSYRFDDKYSIYISSSEFYIMPTTTQIFGNKTGFVPNKDITPMSGRNNEVGFKAKFSKNTQLDFALYNRKNKNAIVIQRYPGYSRYENIKGVSHVKGGEITLNQKIGKDWAVRLGYARVVADDDAQILYVPQTQFSFDVNYRHNKWDVSLQGRNQSDFMPNGTDKDKSKWLPEKNYWVWNLSANYKFDKNFKGFLKVYNIFDKGYMAFTTNTKQEYVDAGADPYRYFGGQGRCFMIGAEYTF